MFQVCNVNAFLSWHAEAIRFSLRCQLVSACQPPAGSCLPYRQKPWWIDRWVLRLTICRDANGLGISVPSNAKWQWKSHWRCFFKKIKKNSVGTETTTNNHPTDSISSNCHQIAVFGIKLLPASWPASGYTAKPLSFGICNGLTVYNYTLYEKRENEKATFFSEIKNSTGKGIEPRHELKTCGFSVILSIFAVWRQNFGVNFSAFLWKSCLDFVILGLLNC